MRKPTLCIFENKDADQLRGNREADQRLCFRYIESTIHLLSNFEISSLYPPSVASCTAWFVSDKVENQNIGFSRCGSSVLLSLIISVLTQEE